MKYHLKLLEESNNGTKSWKWIKSELVHFSETFNQDMQQIQKFNTRYPQDGVAPYASMKCTGCLCYGHLATAYPRRPAIEVHMAEVFNSNVGEVCDEYACHECDTDVNALSVTIIDIRCSAHMFSDWRVFRNFRTKTGIKWSTYWSLWCG